MGAPRLCPRPSPELTFPVPALVRYRSALALGSAPAFFEFLRPPKRAKADDAGPDHSQGDNVDDTRMEEERRLFYVGITRAEQQLILSHAMRRMRPVSGAGMMGFNVKVRPTHRLTIG